MTTPNIAFIITGSGAISGSVNGKAFSIQPDFYRYADVKAELVAKDSTALETLVDLARTIATFSNGKCELIGGSVYYNGKKIANALTTRIIKMRDEGFPIDPMLRFMENLMQNPLESAIAELYLWLEATELPITEDGYFLAYKKVSKDLKSIHVSPDGTYHDHTIGAKPKMKREQVDSDRDRTCSKGLHFCSLSYLPHYGWSDECRVVLLKVNPADVVAIPNDYNNAKGRAWTYEVIGEHTAGETAEAFTESVVSSDGGKYGTKPSGQRYYQVRDAKGHFVKQAEDLQ